MYSFDQRMASAVSDAGKKGWMVAILECKFSVFYAALFADIFLIQWVRDNTGGGAFS